VDIRSDSATGSGFTGDSFSIPGGPDGLTLEIGGEGSFDDFGEEVYLSLSVYHEIFSPGRYPSTIATTMTVTFDLSSDATILFNIQTPMFTGEVTGSSSIKLDGSDVVSGETINLGSGLHTLVFAIDGLSEGWDGGYESFGLDATIAAVPEPGSWALLAGGIVAAWGVARRRVA
jgi:hypothetical protein